MEGVSLVTEPLEEHARRFAKIGLIIHHDDFQSHADARFQPASPSLRAHALRPIPFYASRKRDCIGSCPVRCPALIECIRKARDPSSCRHTRCQNGRSSNLEKLAAELIPVYLSAWGASRGNPPPPPGTLSPLTTRNCAPLHRPVFPHSFFLCGGGRGVSSRGADRHLGGSRKRLAKYWNSLPRSHDPSPGFQSGGRGFHASSPGLLHCVRTGETLQPTADGQNKNRRVSPAVCGRLDFSGTRWRVSSQVRRGAAEKALVSLANRCIRPLCHLSEWSWKEVWQALSGGSTARSRS